MTGDATQLSTHPIDVLIRRMVAEFLVPDLGDLESIKSHIAGAPVDERIRRVPRDLRGRSYLDRRFGAREQADLLHLGQRVLLDEQWATGTTLRVFLEDLRRAVPHQEARLAVNHRRGGSLASLLVRTDLVVPPRRRGARSLAGLIVIYSADRGCLVTGYQYSSESQLSIPGDARWLI